MTEYKLFTQRIGLIGIVNLLGSLSGIIMLPILTKTLPIEEYGAWNAVLSGYGIFGAVVAVLIVQIITLNFGRKAFI